MIDPHRTLGVSPNASEKEIKAAYKKLAKKYHPDLNSDPTAEQKFKEIAQAYAILTGKEKEQPTHDPFQHFYDRFDSIFRNGFSGGFGSGRVLNQIMVDPELLINGGQFQYQFQSFENRGGRLYPVSKTATIHIEADTPVGVQIAVPGTQPNHVFLQLIPGDTPRYRVTDMVNLTENQSINVFKAMVGGEHKVTTPLGKTISIKIPAGTQAGAIHRIRNGGLKMVDGTRGDYNIQFSIVIPSVTETGEEEIKQQVLSYLAEGLELYK